MKDTLILLGLILPPFLTAIGFLFREVLKGMNDRLKECQTENDVLANEAKAAMAAKELKREEEHGMLRAQLQTALAEIAALRERLA